MIEQLFERLPHSICIKIASFTLKLQPNSRILFYDEFYDNENCKDKQYHECWCMKMLPCVRLTANRFACYVNEKTLPSVDISVNDYPWDEHFILNMSKTNHGEVMTPNNDCENIQIGNIHPRTFTKKMFISKSLSLHVAFFKSDCDLFDKVCIDSSNENSSVRVIMCVDQHKRRKLSSVDSQTI